MKGLGFVLALLVTGCGSDDSSVAGGTGGAGGGAGGTTGGTIELGGACVLSSDCKETAGAPAGCRCAGQGPTVCVALTPIGETCALETDCGAGAHCLDDGQGLRCAEYVKSSEGCAEGTCEPGSTCTAALVCGPPIPIGGACSAAEPGPCEAGAYCNGSSGQCVAVVPEGGECNVATGSAGNECGDGFCFTSDASPATCHGKKQEGQACDAPLQCPAGFDCNGVCVRPAAPAQCG